MFRVQICQPTRCVPAAGYRRVSVATIVMRRFGVRIAIQERCSACIDAVARIQRRLPVNGQRDTITDRPSGDGTLSEYDSVPQPEAPVHGPVLNVHMHLTQMTPAAHTDSLTISTLAVSRKLGTDSASNVLLTDFAPLSGGVQCAM